MTRNLSFLVLSLSFAPFAVAACGAKPPPPPEPAPVASAEPPKEEPPPLPPPPKCESLDEKCAAASDTRLAVGGASFQPPLGWTYAKESADSIAVAPDGDGVVIFAEAESADPAKTMPAIKTLLDKLTVTAVTLPKLEKRLKKAQSTVDAGGTQVSLWEVDKVQQGADPKRADKPGSLLVVTAAVGGKGIVAVGFVPKTAPNHAGSIMDAVKSLHGGA